MKIEVGKYYVTRSGQKARIYATDAGGLRPVHGALQEDNGDWDMCGWYEDGRVFSTPNFDSDDEIVGEWQESLYFDWDCLPEWADRYIAMDDKGNWYCYKLKPICGEHLWEVKDVSCFIHSFYKPRSFKGHWRDSLHENPKYKNQK